MFYKRNILICLHCNKIETRKIVESKKLQNIKKFRFRIVLYKKVNLNKNLIKKTVKKDLQKSIDTVLVIGTTIKVSNIKYLITEFSCAIKVQLASTVI